MNFLPQSVCFVTKAAITAVCKKRKRRAIIHSEPTEFTQESLPDPSIASSNEEEVEEVRLSCIHEKLFSCHSHLCS